MAISRKPKSPPTVDVNAIISKGLAVADAPAEDNQKETSSFTLRVATPTLNSLDEHLKRRPLKVARNHWIQEAIVEKLQREQPEQAK